MVAAGVVTLVALTAACGDDGGSADGDGSGNGSGDGTDESSLARPDGREPTPLEEFWQSVETSFADGGDESWREDEQRVQGLIRECMAEQGFEYIPHIPDVEVLDADDEDSPWSLPPDEFAETYGYGISTWERMEEDGGLGGQEVDTDDDPNAAILDEMSEAEREAYERALNGDWSEVDAFFEDLDEAEMAELDESEIPEPEDQGCYGEASEQVFGEGRFPDDAEFGDLWDREEELWERIDDDPRVTEAVADWADCMADAGHPGLSQLDDAYDLVSDRYEEIGGQPGSISVGGPGGGSVQGGVVSVEAEDEGSGEDGEDDEEVDPEELAEVQEYEIEVAVADHECREESGYEDVRYDVTVELEQQFLDENREELERYRDALEASEA